MSEPVQRLLIFVLAKKEEELLTKTARELQDICSPAQTAGIVLLLAPHATEPCRRAALDIQNAGWPIPVQVVEQPSDDFVACVQAVLRNRQDASHILFLASDGFLAPHAIASLIDRAAREPDVIYKLSRALPGGSFSPEYSASQVLLYRMFCVFIRMLFGRNITDPTFVVMVVPSPWFGCVRFQQRSLFALLEWMYFLLRSGVAIRELPAVHRPHNEKSHYATVLQRLRYVSMAVRIRFLPLKSISTGGFDQ